MQSHASFRHKASCRRCEKDIWVTAETSYGEYSRILRFTLVFLVDSLVVAVAYLADSLLKCGSKGVILILVIMVIKVNKPINMIAMGWQFSMARLSVTSMTCQMTCQVDQQANLTVQFRHESGSLLRGIYRHSGSVSSTIRTAIGTR